MNKGIKSFFDGASVLALATVVTKVLGLLYKAPLSRILGDEGMGYFNSAYTVYTFFYILCSAGVPKAISIIISENDAKFNRKNEKTIVKIALGAFFVFGLTLTALFLSFADEISRVIKNEGAYLTMLAIAPSVLFVSLGGVAKGYQSGNSRLVPIAVSQLIEGGAKFFLGILFALIGRGQGMSLPALSAFTILGITLGSVFSALFLIISSSGHHDTAWDKASRPRAIPLIKRIVKIAFPLTLGAAVMSITNMIDLVTVMDRLRALGYTEKDASALYGNYTTLAVPMFNLVTALVSPFFIAALPMLTRSFTSDNLYSFERELGETLKKTYFIVVPSTVAFVCYSEEILSLIFSKDSAILGAPLLTLLAPALVFLSLETLINTALEASGCYKAPIISMLAGCVPKILISYFLISRADFGILAAPLGTVACYAIGFLVSVFILYTKTEVRVPLIKQIIIPCLSSFGALSVADLTSKLLKNTLNGALYSSLVLFLFASLYVIFYTLLLIFTKNRHFFLSNCTKSSAKN